MKWQSFEGQTSILNILTLHSQLKYLVYFKHCNITELREYSISLKTWQTRQVGEQWITVGSNGLYYKKK